MWAGVLERNLRRRMPWSCHQALDRLRNLRWSRTEKCRCCFHLFGIIIIIKLRKGNGDRHQKWSTHQHTYGGRQQATVLWESIARLWGSIGGVFFHYNLFIVDIQYRAPSIDIQGTINWHIGHHQLTYRAPSIDIQGTINCLLLWRHHSTHCFWR